MPALYFIGGQIGWFACTLSAARGSPWIGVTLVLILIAAHLLRSPQPRIELKLLASVTAIGAVWESALVHYGLLAYPSGMIAGELAPYWIVALWALFAAQFNTAYTWLKTRIGVASIVGAIAGPLSFHAGASLGALHFRRPWPATVVLAAGWACLLPLLAVLSRRWDGVRPATDMRA